MFFDVVGKINDELVTAICVVIFWVFMALQPANAQSYRLSEHGRFHGYVTWPLYCGIAKCPDSWANALNVAALSVPRRTAQAARAARTQ